MEDQYNLKRFLDAQASTYTKALAEIKKGKKTSHWMWFIFPQFTGVGLSSTSVKYAIKSREEAINYFQHPILSSRFIEITDAFLSIKNKTAKAILGKPDDMKMKSSMTLFDAVQSENVLFNEVLIKYFKGERCNITLAKLK